MTRGLLWHADELELTLNLTLTGDTTRQNHGRAQSRLVSEYLNTTRDSGTDQWQLVPGVLLRIYADRYHTPFGFDASASVSYHLGIQGTTLTHSESHPYVSDGTFSMTVRFQNYRVWNDAGEGLTIETHKLLFESDAGDATVYDSADHAGVPLRWSVGKYIDILDDFVPTPAHLPLFGTFPTLHLDPFEFVTAQFTLSDPSAPVRDIYQWDMTTTGGWRYKIGGDWVAYPVELVVDPSDGGSCCEESHAPIMSAPDTASGSIQSYYRVEKITHASFPPGEESIWNARAQITLAPNLPRAIKRNALYGALWERFDFPRARVRNAVYCYHAVNAVPVCTTDTTTYRVVFEPAEAMIRRVTNTTSEIESVFEPTLYAPYEWHTSHTKLWGLAPGDLRERQEQKTVVYPVTDDNIHPLYEYRHALINPQVQGLIEYIQTWLHPHWGLLLYYQDWRLGIPLRAVEAEQYWLKYHHQWCNEVSSLPGEQQTQERVMSIAEPLLHTLSDDREWKRMLTSQPTSFVGVSRFVVDDATPVNSVSITESSAWSASGATLAHGTAITVTPTSVGTLTLTLELEDWTRVAAQLCDSVTLTWSGSNITAIEWRGANQQGDTAVIATTTGSHALPLTGDQFYAGSWGQNYSAGAENVLSEPYAETPTDLDAAGVSATTMSDPERNPFYFLFGRRGVKQLVATITVDSTDSFTVEYPIFMRATTRWTPVPETAHGAAMSATNQTLWRTGTLDWGALASTPTVRSTHERANALDYLATRDRLLLNQSPDTSGLDDWYPDEYDTLSDWLTDTYAIPVRAVDSAESAVDNTVRAWIVSALREPPPLALIPRKERDYAWGESGDWSLTTYTIGYIKRYYIANSALALYRVELDGGGAETSRTLLSSLSSDFDALHPVTEISPALTHQEVITQWNGSTVHSPRWLLQSVNTTDLARVTPFHGYSAIVFGGQEKTGSWLSYDVSSSGIHARMSVVDGNLWLGLSPDPAATSWQDTDTGIAGTQPCLRWSLHDTHNTLWCVYRTAGGAVQMRYQIAGGTWSMATTIATAGEYPTLVATRDGRLLIYYVVSSEIRGVMYDQTGTQIVSEFVAISTVDDSPIAADEFVLAGGGWRVNLLYRLAGAITQSSSEDGVQFS